MTEHSKARYYDHRLISLFTKLIKRIMYGFHTSCMWLWIRIKLLITTNRNNRNTFTMKLYEQIAEASHFGGCLLLLEPMSWILPSTWHFFWIVFNKIHYEHCKHSSMITVYVYLSFAISSWMFFNLSLRHSPKCISKLFQ